MSLIKKLGTAVFILIAVWGVSLVWAVANKNMIISNINDNILLGASIEDVQEYLKGENITYGVEKREDMIWLEEGSYSYKVHLAFGIDAPSSIIDLMNRRLIVSIWFDDKSEVALLEFDEGYTFL